MIDIFKEIKSTLDIRDVYQRYCAPVKNNRALCHFHNDRRPSVTFKGEVCSCWVCGFTYDIFDLVAAIFCFAEKPKLSAAKRLNNDFALGYDIDTRTQQASSVRRKFASDKAIVQEFLNEWNWCYNVLCEYSRMLEHRQPYIDYLIDTMWDLEEIGTTALRVKFLKIYRKEVEQFEKRNHSRRTNRGGILQH